MGIRVPACAWQLILVQDRVHTTKNSSSLKKCVVRANIRFTNRHKNNKDKDIKINVDCSRDETNVIKQL